MKYKERPEMLIGPEDVRMLVKLRAKKAKKAQAKRKIK
jgi:hypothetical protein